MSNQQTYLVSIPSVALGVMAATLACKRIWGDDTPWMMMSDKGVIRPTVRHLCGSRIASSEYYKIIDRISRDEQP